MPQPMLRSALALILGLAAAPLAAQTAAAPPPGETATTGEQAAPASTPELLPDLPLGAEDAPVTFIEYASFTCPHCAAFHTDTFPSLKAEYIDTGKVRFIQRDVYFDAHGLWAGILAHCDPQKYYPMTNALMAQQAEWHFPRDDNATASSLRRIGLANGMTAEQMDACWGDSQMAEQLVATYQAHATNDFATPSGDIQVSTPTFYIGGEKVQNQPWGQLKAKIDEKLAEAEAAPAPSEG